MPPRSTWKGFLKVSLVSVPVRAFTATASGAGEIHLNQLHKECNSRINYKKTCPIHGEVSNDEIVSGYEYSKGQYVVIDTNELDKLRTEDDKAITVRTFISPDTLDPVFFSGKSYYLVPDGPVGQKPYAVLRQAMEEEGRLGIAQVVMHGREQLVLVRPVDNLLTMSVLHYDAQITKPSAFSEEIQATEVTPEELDLARTLIEATTSKKFDYAGYKDMYTEKLTQLIEAKVAGKELVATPVHEQAQVINLMDALRQSVQQAQGEPLKGKPQRRMAPSTKGRATEARKKKSS